MTEEEVELVRVNSWLSGKKRKSRHSNEIFGTRKERMLFDRQFMSPRKRVRKFNEVTNKMSRRAKSVRGIKTND